MHFAALAKGGHMAAPVLSQHGWVFCLVRDSVLVVGALECWNIKEIDALTRRSSRLEVHKRRKPNDISEPWISFSLRVCVCVCACEVCYMVLNSTCKHV